MNYRLPFIASATALLLAGCNHTGLSPNNPASIYSADSEFIHVHLYPNQHSLPKNTQLLGKVTAQNHNLDGSKASKKAIVLELKRQAALLGANGLIHITPGTSQTTADAFVLYAPD